MNNEIILGYDGSAGAKAALEQAAVLARDLGARLGVVFGYEPPARAAGEVADQRAAVRELGEALVEEAGERLGELGCDYEILLVDERPVEGIVRVADERDARMIVIGSPGEGSITGALTQPPTARRLMKLTDRPVLVVSG